MAKKENVHLQLSEELSDIDDELEQAMEALSDTNQRIDDFLNENEEEEEESPTEITIEEDSTTSTEDEDTSESAEKTAQSNE